MRKALRTALRMAPVAVVAGGLALAGTPAWSQQQAPACYISANQPFQSSGFVYGDVYRGGGCGDWVRLESHLFKDISFWPDPEIGYGERWLYEGSVRGAGPCSREGHGNYYTVARTSTGQTAPESARATLC